MIITRGGCGCDDKIMVVMIIVTDGRGCDDNSDRWAWL